MYASDIEGKIPLMASYLEILKHCSSEQPVESLVETKEESADRLVKMNHTHQTSTLNIESPNFNN